MATNRGMRGFSDTFTPTELCEWLAANFKENGLELKEEQQQMFLEDEINGLAFRKLNDADLKEMGFKRGPRKNILDIISSLSVEMEKPPVEESNGTAKSAPITPNAPAVGCTMNFSPKITPMSESGPSIDKEAARGCLPSTGYLWPRRNSKPLVVELHNEEYLAEWDLTPDKFLECANRWSTGVVEGGNFIPKFEFNDSLPPNIIVELNKDGKIESDVGYLASRQATKVYLDLRHNDPKYREHLIVHEFGHALALGHEHQRSKLWRLIGDYIDTDRMKNWLGNRYDDWKEDEQAEHHGATEDYDPDSIMHYWFLCDWLRDGYSNKAAIEGNPALSKDAKKALVGILRSDPENRILPTHPSRMDWDFLSDQYRNVSGVPQVQNKNNVPSATSRGPGPVLQMDYGNVPSTDRGSGPTAKRIGADSGHASGSKGSGRGDLSPSLKRSTESDVLQRFHADLNSSIKDPDQFAAQLIQHKFTTKQTADNKMPSGVSDYRKVGNLLGIVDSHISSVSSVTPEQVKERFDTLVSILRNRLGLDGLAQKMETECYGTQQAYEAPSGLNENTSQGIPQVRNKRNAPSTGRGSEPAPKRIRTDYEGGASAANTTSDNLPTLPTMLRILLPMSSQWMNIGTMLSLKHGRLTAIETRCRGVPDNCLREMLNEWLQQVNPRPTKSALVNAVETYNPSLAEKISACENSPRASE